MALTFDANYYLTHRADVFQAFVATAGSTGLTWAQFAQQHYNNHGRFEGSNPNAIFKTNEYLAANPDVAAAGVNPFEHYLAHGVYEGRAPNASFPKLGVEFDADAYLAANSDLAGAGIDTPQEAYAHFVLHGQFENRPGAPVVDNGPTNPGDTYVLTTGVDNIKGTAGDDTITGVLGGGTLTIGDQIDGGAGADVLNITVAAAGTAIPAGVEVRNVETVNIRHADAATNGGPVSINSSAFEGVKEIWQVDNDPTNINFYDVTLGQGVTAGFRSNGSVGSNNTVTAAAGVTDVAIALDGTLNGGLIVAETTANSVSSVSVSGTIAATPATPAAPANFGLTANAADVDTLNISLSSDTNLTLTNFDDLNTLDASGSTGALTINLGTPDELSSAKFGSGNDAITIDTSGLNAATSTLAIDLGAGNDVLTLSASLEGTPVANAVNITLGAGNDTLDVDAVSNISNVDEIEADLITVLDFNAAQDVLDLSGLTTRDVLVNTELANIADAASLKAAVDAAAAATTAGQYSIFNYGGDAYVFVNAGTAGFGAGDGLIKIVGFSVEAITETNFIA